jgi:hypothetical protein
MHALLGRPDFDELTERAGKKAPPADDVRDQGVRLVLSQNSDAPDAGVHTVREREVDVAEMAGERNGRLALPAGQLAEPRSVASRENQRERLARQLGLNPTDT